MKCPSPFLIKELVKKAKNYRKDTENAEADLSLDNKSFSVPSAHSAVKREFIPKPSNSCGGTVMY